MIDYSAEYTFFEKNHDEPFQITSGSRNIIFSAPHTYTHFRPNLVKKPEQGVGVLARLLAKKLDCHSIVKTAENDDDPNYNQISPYKNELCDYILGNNIKYIFDLHELRADREQKVNFLTTRIRKEEQNIALLDSLIELFAKNNLNVTENVPYAGRSVNNLCNTVSKKCKIFALQIEMNSKFMYPFYNDFCLDKVINVFSEVIRLIGVLA